MGRILTRPELEGGATVNGTEIIDTTGAWTGGGAAVPAALTTGKIPYGVNNLPVAKTLGATFTSTTPAAALDLANPVFSGTGLTAAGHVMTTTDNQTMTLNQCAGMWLIPATGSHAPMLILSNTAVTGAPAVLTVQGTAATDSGAYKIVSRPTGSGTVTPTYS